MLRLCSAVCFFAGLLAGSATHAQEATSFQPHTFRGSDDSELKYQLLSPAAAAQPGDEKFPLVLFLHGAGERGSDNKAQLKHGTSNFASEAARQKFPCYVAAPQCSSGKWWNTQADLLLELIADLQKQHRIDPQRIYVTGLSMGGFGTFDLAIRKPQLFAAVSPICGAADPARITVLKDHPIWIVHGDQDQAVPVERSRSAAAALRAAGGHPIYVELPGVGHNSWNPAWQDEDGVLPWLFRQRRNDGSTESEKK